MVNAVGSVSNVVASDAAARVAVRQSAVEKDTSKEKTVSTDVDALNEERISPRISQDALAGALVTEFSDANGQVTQQVPSKAALAYLRAGLTAEGNAKPKEGEPEPVEG